MPATRLLNTKRLLSKLMAMAMAIIQCQAHPPQTRRVKIGRERLKPGICAIRSRPILLFRFCFHRPPFWLSKSFAVSLFLVGRDGDRFWFGLILFGVSRIQAAYEIFNSQASLL